jgi:hypothetical protein
MTSLWRRAFDAIERPLAAASESWVQSTTFMDLAAATIRVQRRLTDDGQRMTEQWLHAWGLPARGDMFRLMNQVASLQRQVRDLERALQLRNGRPTTQPGPTSPEAGPLAPPPEKEP